MDTVARWIGDIVIAAIYVGILAIAFAVHPDLTPHSDLFTGCAFVAIMCSPSVGD